MAKVRGGADNVGAICRAIRSAILERALVPGDKLPEDALGERFGVSRTIARHALGQLAAEGLVELRRNRIAVVATPSFDEARDDFDIRIELEGLVVKALAGRLSEAQIATLDAMVAAEEAAHGGPEAQSLRLATEFHVRLAEMTEKPVLVRYVSEIAYRSCLALSTFGRPHSSECAVAEHRGLIQALATGGVESATALMDEHLEAVARRALLVPAQNRGRDLMDVLAPYAEAEAPVAKRRAAKA
ncbi:GntR family transcriptional regulator [Aureimonas sp. Leaf460]|uniref:GntR family transcriptional regulator n=2 Tax=unclassified Aureimonas TaxID=2615206 RepID=UPI0006FCDA13|nr:MULTISPECIES: GntR family transcriptional regulator [unclassified Aureimonas]KQT64565.1 GntR family transcriptional regulator [Aureimonas sp. Leaf427]KQT81753.1 GntR family transcriptional regulator [Aureimonas sp. Leaf460]